MYMIYYFQTIMRPDKMPLRKKQKEDKKEVRNHRTEVLCQSKGFASATEKALPLPEQRLCLCQSKGFASARAKGFASARAKGFASTRAKGFASARAKAFARENLHSGFQDRPSLMLCCTSCFEAHLTQSHYIKPKFLLPVHSNIVCCCCFFAYFYSAHFSQSSTSLLAHITPQSKNFSTSHHLTSTTIAINTDSYSQLGDKWKQFHILIFNPFFSMISFANVLCSLSLCPPFSFSDFSLNSINSSFLSINCCTQPFWKSTCIDPSGRGMEAIPQQKEACGCIQRETPKELYSEFLKLRYNITTYLSHLCRYLITHLIPLTISNEFSKLIFLLKKHSQLSSKIIIYYSNFSQH
ncbi:hypothetical protein VP01_4262g1 [Puccinia sorghi]|uniref:Uncharacterized protein n=1 Tax=Puccinia sorghi TaxID=27349 RepID=A0A0L6USB1_9BASI|nr:hypothetical protein VP01_4262g1 [Puccinia sorghi]